MSTSQNSTGKMTNFRWIICAMLFFATTVNYLDRQVLSLTWKDFIAPEFHWTDSNYGQSKTDIYYNIFAALPQDMPGIVGTNKLGEDFGMMTNHFILVREELTASQVSTLCDEIKEVDGITQVVSLDSITGPGFALCKM